MQYILDVIKSAQGGFGAVMAAIVLLVGIVIAAILLIKAIKAFQGQKYGEVAKFLGAAIGVFVIAALAGTTLSGGFIQKAGSSITSSAKDDPEKLLSATPKSE